MKSFLVHIFLKSNLEILKLEEILVGSLQNTNKRKMRLSQSIIKTDIVLFTVHS